MQDRHVIQSNDNTASTPWYKRPLISISFLIVLVISISSGLAAKHFFGDKQAPEQITTLYYNDGKTMLWQTGQEEGENKTFISFVKEQLKDEHGDDYQSKGTWKVTTSLDKKLQDTARQQLQEQRPDRLKYRIEDTILIAQDVKNGQIVSWVDDNNRPDGHAANRRKLIVGTLQIPFVYVAFLEKDPAGASTIFEDNQTALPGYPCINKSTPAQGGNCLQNLDGKYLGSLTLGQALGGLRNVPATKASMQAGGIAKIHEAATKMGSDGLCYLDQTLTQKTTCYSASIFGDGVYATPRHIVQAYAALANHGRKSGQSGLHTTILNDKSEYQWKPQEDQVISQNTAEIISTALSDANLSILNERHHSVFRTASGKKVAFVGGYTQDQKLSSTIQFTDKYAIGVWSYADHPLLAPAINVVMPQASNWLNAAD